MIKKRFESRTSESYSITLSTTPHWFSIGSLSRTGSRTERTNHNSRSHSANGCPHSPLLCGGLASSLQFLSLSHQSEAYTSTILFWLWSQREEAYLNPFTIGSWKPVVFLVGPAANLNTQYSHMYLLYNIHLDHRGSGTATLSEFRLILDASVLSVFEVFLAIIALLSKSYNHCLSV